MRIGHGYDVHRLTEGRRLVLGGVEIPFELGLLGHSDADVLTHALMDAILGAAGMGDIGRMFPDNDDTYKDIDSTILLSIVCDRVKSRGFVFQNADCTVIAQKPKLMPYIDSMRARLANIIGVSPDRVNIKATTEEKLGFTGALEGIAAHAVALLDDSEVVL